MGGGARWVRGILRNKQRVKIHPMCVLLNVVCGLQSSFCMPRSAVAISPIEWEQMASGISPLLTNLTLDIVTCIENPRGWDESQGESVLRYWHHIWVGDVGEVRPETKAARNGIVESLPNLIFAQI